MVYAPAEGADTLPLLLVYPYMYFVGKTHSVKEQKRSGTNIGRFFSWPQEESSSAILFQDQEKMSSVEAVDYNEQ